MGYEQILHACMRISTFTRMDTTLIGITNVGRLDYFCNIYRNLLHTLLFSNKVADSDKDRDNFIHHSSPIL